jgi:hypothetical protein
VVSILHQHVGRKVFFKARDCKILEIEAWGAVRESWGTKQVI